MPRQYNGPVNGVTLILASRSQRRVRLLQEAGYCFRQVVSPYVEPPVGRSVDPVALTAAEAEAKAAGLVGHSEVEQSDNVVVLGADTVVVAADGCVMGKPTNRDEAEAMLCRLTGSEHRVVTSVALSSGGGDRQECFTDTARVSFDHLGRSTLGTYLESGLWRGKAGGYDLTEVEHDWKIRVEGDPTTVIGLPMHRLEPVLRRWQVPRPGAHVQPCRATGA